MFSGRVLDKTVGGGGDIKVPRWCAFVRAASFCGPPPPPLPPPSPPSFKPVIGRTQISIFLFYQEKVNTHIDFPFVLRPMVGLKSIK